MNSNYPSSGTHIVIECQLNIQQSIGIFTQPSWFGHGLARPANFLSCLFTTEGLKSPFVKEPAFLVHLFSRPVVRPC